MSPEKCLRSVGKRASKGFPRLCRCLWVVTGLGMLGAVPSLRAQESCAFEKVFAAKTCPPIEKIKSFVASLSEQNQAQGTALATTDCLRTTMKAFEKQLPACEKNYAKNEVFWDLKGSYFNLKGDPKGAREAWLKAVDLNTSSITPNVSLGRSFFDSGDHSEALKYLRRAIIDAPKNKSERTAQVYALTQLLSGLESVPERAFEAGEKLQGLAKMSDRMVEVLAGMALKFGDSEKALAYMRRLPVAKQIPLQIDLYKSQKKYRELITAIRTALRSPKLGVSSALKEQWTKDYYEAASELQDWLELHRAALLCLHLWPGEARYLKSLDVAFEKGAFLNPKEKLFELLSATHVHPNSIIIQELILEELFKKNFESLDTLELDTQLQKRARSHVDRLLALAPQSILGKFWYGFIELSQKQWQEADLHFEEVWARVKRGEPFSTRLNPFYLWRWLLEGKRQIGYVSRAKLVVDDAAQFLRSESDVERLRNFANSNPTKPNSLKKVKTK